MVRDEKILMPDKNKISVDNADPVDRMKKSAGMHKDSIGTGPDYCGACHR